MARGGSFFVLVMFCFVLCFAVVFKTFSVALSCFGGGVVFFPAIFCFVVFFFFLQDALILYIIIKFKASKAAKETVAYAIESRFGGSPASRKQAQLLVDAVRVIAIPVGKKSAANGGLVEWSRGRKKSKDCKRCEGPGCEGPRCEGCTSLLCSKISMR